MREIFVRKADASTNHPIHHNSVVVLLHGKAYSSATWKKINTYGILSDSGYEVVGVDLPGHGRTVGNDIAGPAKPAFLRYIFDQFDLSKVVLVCPSWSSRYATDASLCGLTECFGSCADEGF